MLDDVKEESVGVSEIAGLGVVFGCSLGVVWGRFGYKSVPGGQVVPRLIMMSVNERAGPPLSTSYSVILWSLMGTRRSLMGPGGGV